jgi:dTDP-4-dehydrorhamnose reductase
VNGRGAANVARAAKQQGARLLFLSTDYVFDGTKTTPYTTDDARSPRSVYGQSKAEAEVQLGQILPECCIVRTSWLFGTDGKCFPDTILKLAASRPKLEVVGDQRGCPTYSVDLARALIQLCRQEASGVVHVTNRGECSWYEFAREIIAREGLNTVVHETMSDRFVRPAERPKYSVLSPESSQKRGIEMPEWRDALQRYLAERVSK